ncbi:MAG: hypothetical protein ACI4BD_07770 [Paludibacteraceae bacterium]
MTKSDLKRNIYAFHVNVSPTERFASYDFCYDYFQTNKGTLAKKMEESCFRLWGYLASWGMLRGSSELLQRSPASLEELIKYFDSIASDAIWDMDVPDYADSAKATHIVEVYNKIHDILSKVIAHPTTTLVTKIMLATLGVVPAFDSYFTATFREDYAPRHGYNGVNSSFSKVDDRALDCLYDFYTTNQVELDSIKINVIDFCGKTTMQVYKIAKLIDMYGFSKGVTGEELLLGKFSVAKNRQVQFSRGNLQYLPTENLWRFAEHQYDCQGEKNKNNARNGEITCSEWVDLFRFDSNIAQNINTPDETTPWRMLSHSEWDYLLNKRKNAKDLITFATIDNVRCIVILPDDWDLTNLSIKTQRFGGGNYEDNKFNRMGPLWEKRVVVLPMAGQVVPQGVHGDANFDWANYTYWSSTECSNDLVSKKEYENKASLFRQMRVEYDGKNLFDADAMALDISIDDKLEKIKLQHPSKNHFLSVRLVKDC